jgi:hypothetical protein
VRRGARVPVQFRHKYLAWTYHHFDELKVIIMGNGHGTLRYGVLGIDLFVLAKYK